VCPAGVARRTGQVVRSTDTGSHDERKRQTWPLYTTALHARLEGAPTCLVVVTVDSAIAAWAATPITAFHPGVSFVPLVIGPAQIPWLTAERARREPWLAVLAALAHGNDPGGIELARSAVDAVQQLGSERATFCYDLIRAFLDDVARRALEETMGDFIKWTPRSDIGKEIYGKGLEKGLEQGREEGREEVARRD
jgi:hypothetical protein